MFAFSRVLAFRAERGLEKMVLAPLQSLSWPPVGFERLVVQVNGDRWLSLAGVVVMLPRCFGLFPCQLGFDKH